MKKNVGTIDKALRLLAATAVAVLYFTHIISGTVAVVLGLLAVVFIATAFIGFCPLYLPLGINTGEKN